MLFPALLFQPLCIFKPNEENTFFNSTYRPPGVSAFGVRCVFVTFERAGLTPSLLRIPCDPNFLWSAFDEFAGKALRPARSQDNPTTLCDSFNATVSALGGLFSKYGPFWF